MTNTAASGAETTLPDQPDGIDDQSHDMPDPVRAAERVRAYIANCGDGLYDVQGDAPLYARDLETLTRAALVPQQPSAPDFLAAVNKLNAELHEARHILPVRLLNLTQALRDAMTGADDRGYAGPLGDAFSVVDRIEKLCVNPTA